MKWMLRTLVPLALAVAILAPRVEAALPADMQLRAEGAVQRLNLYRRLSGLAEVVLDATLSDGCKAHADYLNLNPDAIYGGLTAHDEDPAKPGYSAAGDDAGHNSDIYYAATGTAAIDGWYQTYYHRNPMVNPGVVQVGYGDNPGTAVGFTITVFRFQTYRSPGNVSTPGPNSDGAATMGNPTGENPAPVPGFGPSVGNPIIAYFTGATVTWVSSTITANGQSLPHTVIAPNRPVNSAFEYNEICLITDAPLPAGTTIAVEIQYTQSGAKTRSWSFKTSAAGPLDPAAAAASLANGAGTTPAAPAPASLTSLLAVTATVDSPFSYTPSATGDAPVGLGVAGLPAGLAFDGSSISGTPTETGLFAVTLTATNAAGSDTATLFLLVEPAGTGVSPRPLSVKFSESFKQKLAPADGGFKVAGAGKFSLSGKLSMDGVDVASFGPATVGYLACGGFSFSSPFSGDPKFGAGAKGAAFLLTATNAAGKAVKYLKVGLKWNAKALSFKAAGVTPEFQDSSLAARHLADAPGPVAESVTALAGVTGTLETLAVATTGKLARKTVQKETDSFTLNAVNLKGAATNMP